LRVLFIRLNKSSVSNIEYHAKKLHATGKVPEIFRQVSLRRTKSRKNADLRPTDAVPVTLRGI
jgi:hypothetical protein